MKRIAIKYLFNIFSGSTPESGQSLFWDGDYNWFTPDDLGKLGNQIFVTDSKRKVTQEGIDNANLKFAKEYSIIISKRAPIGNLAILSKAASCNQGCFILEEKSDLVNSKYYYYFLSIQKDNLNSLGRGSTFLELNADDMKSFTVPYPTLVQQNKIVAYLDQEIAKIDALIEKKSRLAELLEEKKKATISQAVTKGLNPNVKLKSSGIDWLGDIPEHWEVNKISRVFSLIGSGTTPNSSNISYYAEGDLPWLNTGDLNDEYIYETSKHITQLAVDDHSTLKLFPKDSLVIAMYGATIGKTALTKIACYTNQACCVLNNSKLVSTRFAQFYFISIKETLVNLSNGGGQPNISQGIIKDFMIGYPSLNEQNEIITFLDKKLDEFQELNTKINNSINLLTEKRTAIISAAINGEINL